jgi:hypothetical protein
MSIIIEKKFAFFNINTHHLYLDFGPLLDLNLMISSWEKGLFIMRGPTIEQGKIVQESPVLCHNRIDLIQKLQNIYSTNSEAENYDEISWDDPELSLIECHMDQDPDHPIRQFLETIPSDYLTLAAPFKLHQLTILRLLHYFPLTKDLLESAPTLYWLLAHKILEFGIHPMEAGNILNQKRVRILDWIIDGQASNALMKFINKIELKCFDCREMKLLLRAMRSPSLIRKFQHSKTISINTLHVCFFNPELLSCKFFISAHTTNEQVPITSKEMTNIWRDTVQIGQFLGITEHQKIVAACPSISRLRNLHDKWTARFNSDEDDSKIRAFVHKYGTDQFIEPPVFGTETIIPISNVQGLLNEGRLMRHCVGSYVEKVFSGISYFYQVTEPERGTLEVRINNGVPNINAFRMFANQSPGNASRKMVRSWLENHLLMSKLQE